VRAIINLNAGYDVEMVEEEMTTIRGLHFKNIP
jgi:hypothetical protein